MASVWEGLDGAVAAAVEEQSRTALGTYRHEPRRMGQDANIERSIAEGAYARRQLFELVQNAADAMRDGSGRCEVILTADCLYVANSGEPFTVNGVVALMGTHDSVKRRRSDRPLRSGVQVAPGRDRQPPSLQPVGVVRLRQGRVASASWPPSSPGFTTTRSCGGPEPSTRLTQAATTPCSRA